MVFKGWKSKIRVPSWSGEGPLLTSCVLTWWKGSGAFSGLFYKSTNPFMRALPSWPYHPPKAPSLNTIIWDIRISTWEFVGGTDIQTIALSTSTVGKLQFSFHSSILNTSKFRHFPLDGNSFSLHLSPSLSHPSTIPHSPPLILFFSLFLLFNWLCSKIYYIFNFYIY